MKLAEAIKICRSIPLLAPREKRALAVVVAFAEGTRDPLILKAHKLILQAAKRLR